LKTNVPRWLSQGHLASSVVSFYTASAQHGGDGALYVVLKRNRG
ncbi:MAG: Smr/MutS family protein, partial [Emcibacter sp.]|nr:Smr/MutS family protein [Emcibacter sp.]